MLKIIYLVQLISIFYSCSSSWDKSKDAQLLSEAKENFEPLPKKLIDTKKHSQLIELGRKLYFEKE